MGSAGLYVLPGFGAGEFGFAQPIRADTSFSSVYVGDVVGDGRLDLILVGNDTATAISNNGDGSFLAPSQLILNSQDTPLVADVNGDGTADVLVVDSNGDILYREGNPVAPGSFLPPVIINAGFPSRDIAWVPETLEVRSWPASMPETTPSRSTRIRDGSFVRVGSLSTGQIPAQIVVADLEGDGWDDLVVRNAGDGTFRSSSTTVMGVHNGIRRSFPSADDDRGGSGYFRCSGDRYHGRRQARPGGHDRGFWTR